MGMGRLCPLSSKQNHIENFQFQFFKEEDRWREVDPTRQRCQTNMTLDVFRAEPYYSYSIERVGLPNWERARMYLEMLGKIIVEKYSKTGPLAVMICCIDV